MNAIWEEIPSITISINRKKISKIILSNDAMKKHHHHNASLHAQCTAQPYALCHSESNQILTSSSQTITATNNNCSNGLTVEENTLFCLYHFSVIVEAMWIACAASLIYSPMKRRETCTMMHCSCTTMFSRGPSAPSHTAAWRARGQHRLHIRSGGVR